MVIFHNSIERDLIKKNFILFLLFFAAQLILGTVLIYQIVLAQTNQYLQQVSKRVQEDIVYKNGKWDISRYNADPNVPDTYPLYILASDGFVIDRWKPLPGFLDTSDIKYLLSYKTPKTITVPTDQTWRILSQPIMEHNKVLGVVTIAMFNPGSANIEEEDNSLQENLSRIMAKISLVNGLIDTSNLDVRDIDYNLSFQIVNNYNKIIAKNNNNNSIDRIPNYIDISYVGGIINGPMTRQVRNPATNEQFFLVTQPIFDENGYVGGVIVVGRSVSYINYILSVFLIVDSLLAGGLAIILAIIMMHRTRSYLTRVSYLPKIKKPEVQKITFNKKEGFLSLDEEKITIPYATHQYYLCAALFSAPKKRWEIDELLERFGEQDLTNRRKVYDAMLLINKKVSQFMDEKLIKTKDRTYHINEHLVSKIA